MKTQLLQDIQDSAAGRAFPAAAPRGPTPPRPPDGARRADARAEAGGPAAPFPASDPPPATAGDDPPATAIPDWLAERLREDAAQAERAEQRTRWQRRAVGTGIAAGALSVVLAAALWLVQEHRVDGALVVVANTTPTIAIPVPDDGAAAGTVNAAPRTAVDLPSTPSAMDAPAAAPDGSAGADDSAQPTLEAPTPAPSTPSSDAPTPQVQQASPKRSAARTNSPGASASSTRLRREETLMQCRAHGYDARQCAARACTMTRYGFACRG